jgi:GNAT superfamily N-acetyltransferase
VTDPELVAGGQYEISTDKARLDHDRIEAFLRESYWAAHRSHEVIERSIAASLCFGVYQRSDALLVGFARVVTDYATFSWLADVYIDPAHRGAGLGKALMQTIVSTPELAGVRMLLMTRDAHGLYRQYGFEAPPNPEEWMARPGGLSALPEAPGRA